MPSEEAITEMIEDKFVTVKEELEEIIDEVKNDVDEKAVQISNNKRTQEQSFEQLHTAMNKLRKDLKQLGNTRLPVNLVKPRLNSSVFVFWSNNFRAFFRPFSIKIRLCTVHHSHFQGLRWIGLWIDWFWVTFTCPL